MASVRKRTWTHKGVTKEAWVVTYTDQGGSRRTKTFQRKKEADTARQKIEAEIAGGYHVADAETTTVATAAVDYLRDCERRNKIGDRMTGNTLRAYAIYIEGHIIPGLGTNRLNVLTADQIQDFINEKAQTMARLSCRSVRMLLFQVLKHAVRKKWLRRNPMVDQPIAIPAEASVKKVEPPTREEIRRILAVLGMRRPYEQPHARANRIMVVGLALFAGMRRGEIIGLQWENIDLANGVLRIEHSFSRVDGLKGPKSKAGRREVPISEALRSLIENYAATMNRERTGYVIQGRNGRPLSLHHFTSYEWPRLMKDAGLTKPDGSPKYGLHALRHAYVSLLIDQKLDAFFIKKLVGHANISTTMDVYGHLFPDSEHTRSAIAAVGRQFPAGGLLAAPDAAPAPTTATSRATARERATELAATGMTPQDIARRVGVSVSTIYTWLRPSAEVLPPTADAT